MNFKQLIISFVALAFLHSAAYGGSWAGGTVKNSFGSRDYKLWISFGYRKEKPVPLAARLHAEAGRPCHCFRDECSGRRE